MRRIIAVLAALLWFASGTVSDIRASVGESKYSGPAVSRAKGKNRYLNNRLKNKSGDKYQSHLDGQKHLKFDTKSARDSYSASHPSYQARAGRVLTSSNIQPSHLSKKSSAGKNSSRMDYQNRPLDASEFDFLEKLSGHIPHDATSEKLDAIIDGQRHQERLSREDYNFLAELSRDINDPQISYTLYEIAEKRRKISYE